MEHRTLLDEKKLPITITRLCYQLIENHNDFSNTVIIGIQPRGIFLAERIHQQLLKISPKIHIPYGILDITFFRDDFRRKSSPLAANATSIDFIIEDKKVILIDDVLWTGRTIRAAMDAILAFGRPQKVELLTLVDRKYARHVPVEADYIGIQVDTIDTQKVKVNWAETDQEENVILISEEIPEKKKKK